MKNRKSKKDLINFKYKNKEEIAKTKAELTEAYANLKQKLKESKLKESNLKTSLKIQDEKNKAEELKAIKKERKSLDEEKKLIQQNKVFLKKENRSLKKRIELQKRKQEQLLREEKLRATQEIKNAKRSMKQIKLKQKKEIINLRTSAKTKLQEVNEQIAEERNKLDITKVKQAKLLSEKKQELIEKKKNLSEKRHKSKLSRKQEKVEKLNQAKIEREELKLQKIKAKNKFKMRMQELSYKIFYSKKKREKRLADINQSQEKNIKNEILQAANEKTELDQKHEKKKIKSKNKIKKDFENIAPKSGEEIKDVFDISKSQYTQNEELHKEELADLKKIFGKRIVNKFKKMDSIEITSLNKFDKEAKIKASIERFRVLRENKMMVDIKEFAKYAAYLSDYDLEDSKVEFKLRSILHILTKKRAIKALNGYFYFKKKKGLWYLHYEKYRVAVKRKIVSLPTDEFYDVLMKTILKKLSSGAVIQISNNIAIQKEEDTIVSLHDAKFMTR